MTTTVHPLLPTLQDHPPSRSQPITPPTLQPDRHASLSSPRLTQEQVQESPKTPSLPLLVPPSVQVHEVVELEVVHEDPPPHAVSVELEVPPVVEAEEEEEVVVVEGVVQLEPPPVYPREQNKLQKSVLSS